MTMPEYPEALSTSVDQVPFSNGTEFEVWQAAWCLRPNAQCKHDEMDSFGGDLHCPLLDVAFLDNRTPAEWGERTSALGHGMYTCSKYEAARDGR